MKFDRAMTLISVHQMIDGLSDENVADLWEWLCSKRPKKKNYWKLSVERRAFGLKQKARIGDDGNALIPNPVDAQGSERGEAL